MRWVLGVGAALLLACASPCPSTCDQLYTEDGCAIQRPGRNETELVNACRENCGEAWSTRGEVGDYDPYTQVGAGESVTLETRGQVDVWAECIDETSCESLEDGFCAPVW